MKGELHNRCRHPACWLPSRSPGLHHIDTHSDFEGLQTHDFWIYELDPHPSSDASGIFAQVIARFSHAKDLIPNANQIAINETAEVEDDHPKNR